MFLIIPCGHPIKVKIFSLKKLKKIVEINSATILKFNLIKLIENNGRFLLKFFPSNSDESLQKSKWSLILALIHLKIKNQFDFGVSEH